MDKKKKAAQLKKRIAEEHIKALEKFETTFTENVANEVPEALEGLERYRIDYFSAMTQLMELDDGSDAIEACIQERIAMDDRCRHLHAFLRDRQPRESNPLGESTLLSSSSTFAYTKPNASNLRLPKIDLPVFDGEYSKWLSFRDRFLAMIDASTDLPAISKLQYLLSSLRGEAAIPYEHTTLTADNYATTWASLLKRYDNSRLLIREYYRALHQFPTLKSENVDELSQLVDEFGRHVNGLKKLHEPIEHWDTPLSNMLLMKLDPTTILAWEKHSVNSEKDKYKEVIDFLHERIQILKSTQRFSCEAKSAVVKVAGNQRHPTPHRRSITNAASMQQMTPHSTAFHPMKCTLQCAESHTLRNCPVFLNHDTQQRREIVKSKGLCWNCLSGSHLAKDCKSEYTCRSCRERHHTLLHQASQPKVTLSVQADDEAVFLETAIVLIADDYGMQHEARALLDSGSMPNFISERLARKLLTSRSKVNVSVSGIGKSEQHVRGSITATVRSKTHNFNIQLEFLILDTPSADIPTSPIDVSSLDMPNVTLADPTYHIPGMIDIVIGGDAFWNLHSGRKRSLGPGRPWLVETQFGWAVAGNSSQPSHSAQVCHIATNENQLEAIMTRFWETETIVDDPVLSTEEDSCEKHYVSTTTRNPSGRYVVSLPTNPNPGIVLGVSRETAERRFLALERRLNANPQMKTAYSAFMEEYEKLGHMKRLPGPVDDSCPHYYLPHHAVLKEKSTSTKVRVVFDASCKTSTGFSLNDTLLVGPIIQQDLFSIMLRFRSHAIALITDVEKMYRQILHNYPDKNLLRILYRENPNEPINTYELQTVTYGTASAPFLATRTLKQIAYDQQESYPRAVNAVLNDFYMDDLLSGTEELSDAIELRMQISSMLSSAGFSLKKWASNNPKALVGIPREDLAILPTHEWQDSQTVSTLGITWEPLSDTFRCRVELPAVPAALTKRIICSYIAKLFDPLGLIGPAILIAKLFMQQLWGLKHEGKAWDWDRQLPSSLQEQWQKFHAALNLLRELQVPRFISQYKATNVQLHLFADASQRAYGTCCYIRAETDQRVTVQLLAAKSKVVSLSNTHSIARLELCAARLATQLYRKVTRSFNTFTVAVCWTDSMTVLHWLNSPPNRWKPFVANRIAKIQGETGIQRWKHVPGIDNPADDVSRGLHPDKLLACERWWHGPQWLSKSSEYWPEDPLQSGETIDCDEERRATCRIAANSTVSEFRNTLFSRFSIYHKLRRVLAYCMRYIQRLRDIKGANNQGKTTTITHRSVNELVASVPLLTVGELQLAELRLCHLSQLDSFHDDLHNLGQGKELARHSKLKWASPFIDPMGILRVGGRLRNADIPDATKHPIILDSRHPLASLIVSAYHLQLLHAGPQLLLASLRQRFWIIGGRSLSKFVYHRCHVCFKAKPTLVKQCIADLPSSRVSPTAPFAVCGVDYCGPVLLKATIRNRSPTKAYIAIFVCFATKAVHIELVGDLTTTAFLGALRRLVARRGRIKELHSDNATTFKGASHELHRIYKMLKCNEDDRAQIFNWCTHNEMTWKFIPPRAPHFGGLWEAAVKSAKKHIIRSIGTISITQENMLTLLAQVEQCLNSRPLTPLSNEPSDLEPLTPAHFLIGRSMQAVPEVDYTEIPDCRLKEYQLVQKNVRTFWSRWMPEYLQQLQACAKHCSGAPVILKENQLVIIKEDNVHPTMWPMGRIIALHPGKDGIVRVVTLRTASGKQIVRPSVRLAILPIPNEETTQ